MPFHYTKLAGGVPSDNGRFEDNYDLLTEVTAISAAAGTGAALVHDTGVSNGDLKAAAPAL